MLDQPGKGPLGNPALGKAVESGFYRASLDELKQRHS